MALNDTLANALSHLLNCEKRGKKICVIRPISNFMVKVMELLKEHGYIGDFKVSKDRKGGQMEINLLGNINKCGAIKPRFSVSYKELEKYEKRFLPAKDFGIIILTTTKGLLTHIQAKEQKIGGKLVAYCY